MKFINRSIFLALGVWLLSACSKNDYFNDTGKAEPNFNGTIMQYLQSKPEYFDSLVKIINIAGYADVLNRENITFFAPADSSIKLSLRLANEMRDSYGKPRISSVAQIDPAIWRKYLSRYIFDFSSALNDFPQIDFGAITSYPGRMYKAHSGEFLNIGVIYDDLENTNSANGTTVTIKYAGYRHLAISYLNSPFSPTEVGTWTRADISTANIKPKNGFVHIIKYSNHRFGFSEQQFSQDVALFNNF